ncbi:MAG TPA: cytochrome c biogenesis CcdA family protein [Candidatus Doudnabacteria bacterium]|nr:cytochrome c biogenesis CcdA family protein [Candidatus Doudnabacteria bacterium]
MLEILFAVLAGILTVGAPCILPLLPILLGSSIGGPKTRPLFIAGGFALTFAVLGLTLSWITTSLNIDPNILRHIAVVMLGIFGLLMIWPTPFEKLTLYLSGFSTRATSWSRAAGNGNFGGLILGITLGIIWTPCAGPVLGSILTLIATQSDLVASTLLLSAYAVGAGIPMLVIAYGGQLTAEYVRAITPYTTRIQQVFGVVIILMAMAIFFGYDMVLQTKILDVYDFGSLESKLLRPNR